MCLQFYIFIFNGHSALNDDFLHTLWIVTQRMFVKAMVLVFYVFLFIYLKMWNVYVMYVAHVNWKLLKYCLVSFVWLLMSTFCRYEKLMRTFNMKKYCLECMSISSRNLFCNLLWEIAWFSHQFSMSLSTHNFYIKILRALKVEIIQSNQRSLC